MNGSAAPRWLAAPTGLDLLEGRDDLAALWDIRVAPSRRRCGAGGALFAAAVSWAAAAGCRQIKIETQNVNVAACRFYARNGCILRAVNRGIYPAFPEEIQMLWDRDLGMPAPSPERQAIGSRSSLVTAAARDRWNNPLKRERNARNIAHLQ